MTEHKDCSKCGKSKPLHEYTNANGGNYTRPECKQCAKEARDAIAALKASVQRPDDSHTCPICGSTRSEVMKDRGKNKGWCLDHCHETKGFRGWICHRCNLGLGNFKDSIESLKRAVEYLETTKPTKNQLDMFE
jgi:hypothetical protein